MSGFTADWLRQRAPFDAAARSSELGRRYGAALVNARNAPTRIVDLAAGTGANFMALAPLIDADQDWLLVDHDPVLLAAQADAIACWSRRAGWRYSHRDGCVSVETPTATWRCRGRRLDLAQDLELLDFAACDGVTTSAFLDLVSAVWLERLCGLLARHAQPLLAALTVDGRRAWHPALPADAYIHQAFLRDQARDKGFGPALGAQAAGSLSRLLGACGYEVITARSDWRIDSGQRDMLRPLLEETAAVAREMQPAACALVDAWSQTRTEQLSAGVLTLAVGHLDLLALPAGI